MVQGVLTNGRVRLLLSKGSDSYRPRRAGERKRKSVRGCIVGADLATINLVILKNGDAEIPGLTDKDSDRPRRLAPKRAGKIRKLFDLTKADDLRKFVIARSYKTKKGKEVTKRPKIQRLVTPLVLQRKRAAIKAKKDSAESAKKQRAEYERMRAQRAKEHRDSVKARRSSRRSSKKETTA